MLLSRRCRLRSCDSVKTLLDKLGYDQRWLDYGFLDPAILRDQIAELESGDDTSTEHYRYRSFVAVLKSRTTLSEKEIDGYIELALTDPDINMGEAALRDLAEWPNSTLSDGTSRRGAVGGTWA